ncbi:hypothetical protein D3C83_135820 [compost metagenome]
MAGTALNLGMPSRAMFSFPEDPRILKLRARRTTSGGRSFASMIFRNVRFGSRLDTTVSA